ncbi:hypothetical protein ACFV0D_16680, partial [Streptomyces sp. NPDC059556]
ELSDRQRFRGESGVYTWILDPEGESFVVASNPNWREAEYALMGERESLYDGPWPPEFPAESGNVS